MRKAGLKPRSFFLWGNSANQCATVLHKPNASNKKPSYEHVGTFMSVTRLCFIHINAPMSSCMLNEIVISVCLSLTHMKLLSFRLFSCVYFQAGHVVSVNNAV